MVSGRVVRYDGARGYGFIAPDHGGEDVFLHANDMLIPEAAVRSGLAVEFEIEDGDRGLKASSVRLPAGVAAQPADPAPAAVAVVGEDDDSLCDVLTAQEFRHEVTELLMECAPTLTGEQILQVRRGLLQFGRRHGWTEG
ncbi:cold shock domain-containing protein [Kitasatospora sp. NBC_00240]|uniref:cold-shock protein n=1 Tax=Kitasatospora sp. NBC_00240 TaxID=2903567 RepID=UPI00224DE377|nr:cold shock domain-containing protein [Kitasatospora sp. NBC_00240]MCX5215120.1 cold shock domain-containing protein [Kitasatospora sp. NBC_00240]